MMMTSQRLLEIDQAFIIYFLLFSIALLFFGIAIFRWNKKNSTHHIFLKIVSYLIIILSISAMAYVFYHEYILKVHTVQTSKESIISEESLM